MFHTYYADLHIHVGMSASGKWIKIPTSRHLTVRQILADAAGKKGLDIIGIIDALSPYVLSDLEELQTAGLLHLLPGGGYRYQERLTLLLGAEIETAEQNGGLSHTLVYLPDLQQMREFSQTMSQYIRNIYLSSQNAHMSLSQLVQLASGFDAWIIPAHIFTPHKSLYGVCTSRLADILPEKLIAKLTAVELGLSADSELADRLLELADFTFLTNSDAHSPAKIGREYTVFSLAGPNFNEIYLALKSKDGRHVSANYGLDPRLGKYHRNHCSACGFIVAAIHENGQNGNRVGEVAICPQCGSNKMTCGVWERIDAIADYAVACHPPARPPYHYQIPLEFIPGLGPKLYQKLLSAFTTEIQVLHKATAVELNAVAGEKIAARILAARAGQAQILAGGGGVYGRLAP